MVSELKDTFVLPIKPKTDSVGCVLERALQRVKSLVGHRSEYKFYVGKDEIPNELPFLSCLCDESSFFLLELKRTCKYGKLNGGCVWYKFHTHECHELSTVMDRWDETKGKE